MTLLGAVHTWPNKESAKGVYSYHSDALEVHQGTVSIRGKTITNLRFADDIDGQEGKEEELASLVDRLDNTSAAFGMEISAEKTKLMTNNANRISIDIRINGEKSDHRSGFQA